MENGEGELRLQLSMTNMEAGNSVGRIGGKDLASVLKIKTRSPNCFFCRLLVV